MNDIYCPQYCPTCTKFHSKDKTKQACPVRSKTWLEGINTILSSKRLPGEGTKLANELIHYMNNEFMSNQDPIPF